MRYSKHSQTRINQRGINKELVSLALYLSGHVIKDNKGLTILKKREIVEIIEVLNHIKKQLLRLLDKKGLVVITQDNTILTAFNNHKRR